MEDSKLNPEDNNSTELVPNQSEGNKDLNEANKKEENIKAFTEFLEKASNQDSSEEKVNALTFSSFLFPSLRSLLSSSKSGNDSIELLSSGLSFESSKISNKC